MVKGFCRCDQVRDLEMDYLGSLKGPGLEGVPPRDPEVSQGLLKPQGLSKRDRRSEIKGEKVMGE